MSKNTDICTISNSGLDWPDDFGAGPQKVERSLLERDIQEKCVDFARSKGYWARKFSSPANRSVPDYIFAKRLPNRIVAWAEEFKAPGKLPTTAQRAEQDLMIAAGWTVHRDTGTNGWADIVAFKRRILAIEANC